MAREFNRTDRVGSQMQRELAELVRTELEGQRLGMVTIQPVQVSGISPTPKSFSPPWGVNWARLKPPKY